MTIDTKKLKNAVKLINDSGLLEKVELKNIRTVGVKTESLLNEFGDAVDALADKKLDKDLDPSIIKYYNEAFGDTEPEKKEDEVKPKKKEDEIKPEKKEDDTEPEKKEGTSKKEKTEGTKKKKTAPKTETKPRSCYGHIASAKSGQLDEMLNEGATYGELMKECDVKLHRVKGHITVLKKKGLTVLINEDKDDATKTKVTIEEDSI